MQKEEVTGGVEASLEESDVAEGSRSRCDDKGGGFKRSREAEIIGMGTDRLPFLSIV